MMALSKGEINKTYRISAIETVSDDLRDHLFNLGCYPGEEVTIVAKLASSFIVNIKDARYSIDKGLASTILV